MSSCPCVTLIPVVPPCACESGMHCDSGWPSAHLIVRCPSVKHDSGSPVCSAIMVCTLISDFPALTWICTLWSSRPSVHCDRFRCPWVHYDSVFPLVPMGFWLSQCALCSLFVCMCALINNRKPVSWLSWAEGWCRSRFFNSWALEHVVLY